MEKCNPIGMINLMNGIVEQAATDYVKAKTKILSNPDKNWSKSRETDIVDNIAKWFRTGGFNNLYLDFDGGYIVKQLDEMVEERVHVDRLEEKPQKQESNSNSYLLAIARLDDLRNQRVRI